MNRFGFSTVLSKEFGCSFSACHSVNISWPVRLQDCFAMSPVPVLYTFFVLRGTLLSTHVSHLAHNGRFLLLFCVSAASYSLAAFLLLHSFVCGNRSPSARFVHHRSDLCIVSGIGHRLRGRRHTVVAVRNCLVCCGRGAGDASVA